MTDTPTPSKLGLCAWSMRPKNPDDLLAILGRLGVQSVQLPAAWLLEDPDTWKPAVDKLRGAGVHVASVMVATRGEDYSTLQTIQRTGGLTLDEHWEHNRRTLLDAAAMAEQLGIAAASFHAGFIPEDEAGPAAQQLLDRLRAAATIFADRGLDLLLETGQETADTLDALLTHLDQPRLGVNFDPANMILYGKGDPIAALKRLLPRVGQVHIKDAVTSDRPGEAWGREVPVGEGEVDWRAFVEVLREGGFEGGYMIEREAGDQREADAKKAVDRIASLLK